MVGPDETWPGDEMSLHQLEDQKARLSSLLTQVDDAIRTKELIKAATILREASQLEPENEDIKRRWLALQTREAGSADLLADIKSFTAGCQEEDAKKVVRLLGEKQLDAVEVSEAYDALVGTTSNSPSLDEVLGAFLARQIEARRLVATKLTDGATEVFEQFLTRGDDAFRAFTGIALDASLWSSQAVAAAAQQDLFRLCIASLIGAGVERPDRLMKAVARQLAIQPDKVTSLIDGDVFDIILSQLDIRHDSSLRSQAMVAMSRLLEVSSEKGEKLFAGFVTSHVAKKTNDDLIMSFSAAAAVFPVLPEVASRLFLTDGFVQGLMPHLERGVDAAKAGKKKSKRLEQAALELLSAACVNKSCRELIRRHCIAWLQTLSDERDGVHEALAALVLAKVSEESIDEVTSKLSDLALSADNEPDQAVEGLAYVSLQPKMKDKIVAQPALLARLVTALKGRPSASFGTLTVFSNLTAYPLIQSEEAKKMSQLKAYANSSKPAPEDPLDDEKHVTARCKTLLDQNLVPAIVACCRQTVSPAAIALAVRILLSIAKEQKHRPKMAQQGSIRLLLQIVERSSKTDKSTNEASLVERTASHALARLLISINPAHVFTSGLPATSAVSALIPLLSTESDSEERDLLPIFEALLALTNLASMEDNAAGDLVIRSALGKIEDLLFSSNTMVQRASVELVCNLMASPNGVASFADGSSDANRRMQILLALADVEDLATRRAAGGALAMLTEWDLAMRAVLDAKDGKGVKSVLTMCKDDSEEMRHRGMVCVSNLVNGPGEIGSRSVRAIKQQNGVEALTAALKRSKTPEVLSLGIGALKQLV